MTDVKILLVLSSVNLLFSFINFLFYMANRNSHQEEEEDEMGDEKEELLLERDLNSRLRHLQTTRFGPPMFSYTLNNTSTRKIRNDDEKR